MNNSTDTKMVPSNGQELITIHDTSIPLVEHLGERVITLAMVDEVHKRAKGTARKRFNDHKHRLIEGTDYFVRNSDEARDMGFIAPSGLTLLAESGYLMLVKSLSDDLAWSVQRELVNSYFRKPIPATKLSRMEILQIALESEQARIAAESERDQAIATKAQISSSREASVMGKLSAASRKMQKLEQELGRNSTEATMIAVEKAMGQKYGKQGFRPLKKWCKDNGVTPNKVPCPRYGEVVAWPAQAWLDCYGVALSELFGREDAA